ncbi:uncharacterized protein LOC144629503 isoform X4 [Oculina patagonica]
MKILVVLSFVLLMLGTGAVEGRGAAPFTTLLFRRKCTAKQASSKACASGGTCYAFWYSHDRTRKILRCVCTWRCHGEKCEKCYPN